MAGNTHQIPGQKRRQWVRGGAWGAGGRLGPGAVKPGGTSLGCWLRWKSKLGCERRDDEVGWEVKARAPVF